MRHGGGLHPAPFKSWRRLAAPVDLAAKVNGVRFANPLILASGILDETGASMARAGREGAGGVVTKSVSLKARMGHAGPNVVEVEGGLLNAMGLPGPGLDHFADEVAAAQAGGAVVVGSVFGGSAAEFAEAARRMAALGPPILELNVSCPHAKGYGTEIGADPLRLAEVTRAVKAAVKVPVWVKLTPNTDEVARLAKAAVDAGADGLVCTNTLKAIAIEPDVRRPVLGNLVGGLSGHALKPVALRAVWDCHAARLGVPIIASGGIYTARDVAEFAMAGASLFQVGTAVMHEGWGVFRAIRKDLEAWMKREGIASLGEVCGAAHVLAPAASKQVGTAG
jgi:dihydroorotate dehydrogenase (NAD+) catalytic subunit